MLDDPLRSTLDWPWIVQSLPRILILLVPYYTVIQASIGAPVWGADAAGDWETFVALEGARNTYATGTAIPFVWSPVMAPLMIAVTKLGYWPWAMLHVAALGLLWRRPILLALMVTSIPFWVDVAAGNVFTFVVVTAALAFAGSFGWSLGFLLLVGLVPRPVYLPMAVWLLWTRPELRRPALVGGTVYGLAVLSTGRASDWIAAMIEYAGAPGFNFGLPLWFGPYWLPIGVTLAVVLTWRGCPAWAGLLASPYWLPTYALMPLLDIERALRRRRRVT